MSYSALGPAPRISSHTLAPGVWLGPRQFGASMLCSAYCWTPEYASALKSRRCTHHAGVALAAPKRAAGGAGELRVAALILRSKFSSVLFPAPGGPLSMMTSESPAPPPPASGRGSAGTGSAGRAGIEARQRSIIASADADWKSACTSCTRNWTAKEPRWSAFITAKSSVVCRKEWHHRNMAHASRDLLSADWPVAAGPNGD